MRRGALLLKQHSYTTLIDNNIHLYLMQTYMFLLINIYTYSGLECGMVLAGAAMRTA